MPSVLITGAARGIGLALTRQYRGAGWRVFACCREPGRDLEALVDDQVTLHTLDVSDDEQILRLAAALEGAPLDVLFNNAGIYGPEKDGFGSLETAGFLQTLQVNTLAPLLLAQALMPNLRAGTQKVIATLTSRMGSIADNHSGGHYPYRASKAALNAALKSLSLDLKSSGFRVLVMHPGWVKTDMGGPHGELTPDQSAASLRQLVDRAHMDESGCFMNVDGHRLPW